LKEIEFFERDLSWLSFNYRVLQEAKNSEVPLMERLKFLAIYSSNLDEFYRVRVASHRNLLRLKKSVQEKYAINSKLLIKKINKIVNKQQTELGEIFSEQLIPEFKKNNIFLVNENNISPEHEQFVRKYFKEEVVKHISLIRIIESAPPPFLENKLLYFATTLESFTSDGESILENVIINIPSNKLPRFQVLPSEDKKHQIIFLDDIIRLSIDILFLQKKIINLYSIKLSRDADLHLEDEFTEDLVEKIKLSLKKRTTGIPSRFLYDLNMPKNFLMYLKKVFFLQKEDLIPGGKYHNFNDFFSFPCPEDKDLFFEKFIELPHSEFIKYKSVFNAIADRDFIFHFPYQSYDNVIRFIEESSNDKKVKSIKITLYRVADTSRINKALINASIRGIDVTAFDEVQARFDEESNIYWGDELAKAGVNVIYSYDKLKVHAKVCLVAREENEVINKYAFLSSGNFNEKTARIYCDHGLLTSDKRITRECDRVFDYLEDREKIPEFGSLLVAPFKLRSGLKEMIKEEIQNAKAGKKAKITLKMNSLEDKDMITQLYKASNAGVKIRIIVRGICCLIPGVKGMSENIKIISIVDRYLEHARIYVFYNNGDEKIYISSADWMKRNLSRRVEVAFPIYEKNIREEIRTLIKFQLKDNAKARKVNITQSNPFKKFEKRTRIERAQYDTYYYLKRKHGK